MSKNLQEAVVERAAQLIEKGGCRGALAHDGEGNKVGVYSDGAVAYCVVEALLRATREVVGETETRAANGPAVRGDSEFSAARAPQRHKHEGGGSGRASEVRRRVLEREGVGGHCERSHARSLHMNR